MSYSRRELYAMGEPLGDSATYRRADGGLVLGGGGGGSPAQTTTSSTELPDWAKGYGKDVLAKGAALTDINQNPYQQYNQERNVGFNQMQTDARDAAMGMQPNQATGAGINAAGSATLGALNTNYQGGQFQGGQFGNRQAAQYMSPYAMQALQPELQEQARNSAILGQQNQAKAVGQGAFGGSRSGLVEAERQRNLGMQQGNTIQTGMNTAYNNAMQQFNADAARNIQAQQMGEQSRQYGAGLGLQGLQTALTGANALGALGGQQFQQGMDINKLQSAYGGQQQALDQQRATTTYQDFLDKQNYPYKQLSYMSDLIRGTPVGMQSSNQVYQAAPSLVSQAAGLGTAGIAGLGLYNTMNK
jgi:hypothetical protein